MFEVVLLEAGSEDVSPGTVIKSGLSSSREELIGTETDCSLEISCVLSYGVDEEALSH